MAKQNRVKLNELDKYSSLLNVISTGTDPDTRNDVRDSLERITKNIQLISGTNTSLTRTNTWENVSANTTDNSGRSMEARRRMVNITNLMMGLENPDLYNSMIVEEQERLIRYADARGVTGIIPEIITAYEVYRSGIISPDQFNSRQAFISEYLGYDPESQIANKLKNISEKYELDNKIIPNAIYQSLEIGDAFVLCMRLEKGLRGVFANIPGIHITESGELAYAESIENYFETSTRVLRETIIATRQSATSQSPEYIFSKDYENTEIPNNVIAITREEIDKFLFENGGYGIKYNNESTDEPLWGNSDDFIKDVGSTFKSSIAVIGSEQFLNEYLYENLNTAEIRNLMTPKVVSVKSTDGKRNSSRDGMPETPLTASDNLPGSIIKNLPPEQIIKLYSGGQCHGYLYYEEDLSEATSANGRDIPTFQNSGGIVSAQATHRIRTMINRTQNLHGTIDASATKNRMLVDMFGTLLSKQINKTKLMNSPDYAHFVYNMLDRFVLKNKRIRVTFFQPDEVVHYAPNMNMTDGYGRPFTHRIMFYAKMLLGLVTNTLMWNIKRNREHNLWSIEVGEDESDEEIISQFVSDIRAKEITTESFGSITNTIATAGQMNDMFAPVTDGQRMIERETMQDGSGDRAFDSELIKFIVRGISSALIIPPQMVGGEDMEFKFTTAMLNGRLNRKTSEYQAMYQPSNTELLRQLYINEYVTGDGWKYRIYEMLNSVNQLVSKPAVRLYLSGLTGIKPPSEEDRKLATKNQTEVVISLIYSRFNQPATLTMQMNAENLRGLIEMVDSLVNIYFGQTPAEGTELQIRTFRTLVAKQTMPQLAWELYEELYQKALVEGVRDKLEPDQPDTSTEDDISTDEEDV